MNISHAIPGADSRATITVRYGQTVQVSWGNVFRVCRSVVEAVQYLSANDCPDWNIQ
jgi:hypothetical protein